MDRIPIIINGSACGSLTVRREGAYMLCRAHTDWRGGMVRLWLYGEGEPGYLGVLQSDGTLRKRFSLADFSRLPCPIEYCADAPRTAEPPPAQPESAEGDVLWVRQFDGTLLRREGRRQYIAFPADGVRLPRGGGFLLRRIEGREYVIFPY